MKRMILLSLVLLSSRAFAKSQCETNLENMAVSHVAQTYHERFFDTIVSPTIVRATANAARVALPTPSKTYIVDISFNSTCSDLRVLASDFIE